MTPYLKWFWPILMGLTLALLVMPTTGLGVNAETETNFNQPAMPQSIQNQAALQSCLWLDATGGDWGNGAKWNMPPDQNCHAAITLDGTYTVVVSRSHTVGQLTLGGTSGQQTLWIKASTFAAGLTVITDTINAGTIRLENAGGVNFSRLIIKRGTLTNTGTINVNKGSDGERVIEGNVVNRGLLRINDSLMYDLPLDSPQATFTNEGVIEIAAGESFGNGFSPVTINNTPAGVIRGAGTLAVANVAFTNSGMIAPGLPLGALNVTGDYPQTESGTLQLEIAGRDAGTEYDQLLVSGEAQLDGTLAISFTNGFSPMLGDRFTLVTCGTACTGQFATVQDTWQGVGLKFELVYSPTAVIMEVITAPVEAIAGLTIHHNGPTALGQSTAFSATVTAGEPLTLTWQLGDGTTTIGPAVEHTYGTIGTYTVLVTATNPISTVTATATITVAETITGLSASNNGPTKAGDPTTLSATKATGSGVSYLWNFGDGTTAAGQNPSHTYPGEGLYTATVTASNIINVMTATTLVSILPPNQPPNALDDTATVLEDQVINIAVLNNDTDSDPLTIAAVTTPGNGSTTINGLTVRYSPATNFNGQDTFTYIASDGSLTDTAKVTVTITPVNDRPAFTPGPHQVVLKNDSPQSITGWASNIVAGPSNESGQSLQFTLVNDNSSLFTMQPELLLNGTLNYAPAPNVTGTATVSVTLSDNGGTANGGLNTSPVQTFVITVAETNDPPQARADMASTHEDTPVTILALENDSDPNGNPLSIIGLGTPANGTVTTSNGTIRYSPAANFNGVDSFSYTISDGMLNDTATVTVTVTAVNDAPSFSKGANQTVMDNAGLQVIDGWATAISAGPANENGQTVQFVVNNDNPSLFAIPPSLTANGQLRYQPAVGTSGSATVTVTLIDSGGTSHGGVNASPAQTFTITVNVNRTGAVIQFEPLTATLLISQTHLITVRVYPGTSPINGVQVHGRIDPAYVRLLSIQPTGALPTTFSPATINPATGVFSYSAGLSSGATTDPLSVLTLQVQAISGTTTSGIPVEFLTTAPATAVAGPGGSLLDTAHNGTIIVSPPARLQGIITWQDEAISTNPNWSAPLTVDLFQAGQPVLVRTTVVTANQFGAFTVADIPPGNYDIRLKGNHTLRNLAQNVSLVAGDNLYNFGWLREGDVETATTFNQVVLEDFGRLNSGFNTCTGNALFVPNADLNEDGCITVIDFGLLSANIDRQGDIEIVAVPDAIPITLFVPQATLDLLVDETNVVADEPVTITVNITPNGDAINGAMVHVDYDPAQVEIASAQLSDAFPLTLVALTIDEVAGTIKLGAGDLGQTITQPLTLATVVVKVKSAGVTTAITPVTTIAIPTDISGPNGSVLSRANGLSLTTSGSGPGLEQRLYLPVVVR